MLVGLKGVVHLSLLVTQLDDSLLRLSKNLYLREQLMVELRYYFSLVFCDIADARGMATNSRSR